MSRFRPLSCAMQDAFNVPLVSFDSFLDVLRRHFFVAFEGNNHSEVSRIDVLETETIFAYCRLYGEYRSGRLIPTVNDVAARAAEILLDDVVERVCIVTDEVEEVTKEWVHVLEENDELYTFTDGEVLVEGSNEDVLTLPGVINASNDDVYAVVNNLAFSFANELVNNGNIPMYFDIMFGYEFGEEIMVSGSSFQDAIVAIGPKGGVYGSSLFNFKGC